MTDYEKGSPEWDIGAILTRHANDLQGPHCARVESLRKTRGTPAKQRLTRALATRCDCKAGDSDSERTSILAPVHE